MPGCQFPKIFVVFVFFQGLELLAFGSFFFLQGLELCEATVEHRSREGEHRSREGEHRSREGEHRSREGEPWLDYFIF